MSLGRSHDEGDDERKSRLRVRLKTALALAAVLTAVLWLNLGGLTGSERIAAHHDNLDGANPLRLEAARQWKSGHVPLWNPYKRMGSPLLADPTVGALYPGNIPYLFGDGRPRYAELEQVAVLHALLAALFMYFFLRTMQLGQEASALGALVYAGSGLVAWLAGNYIQMQNSLVWLPLILGCLHRASTAPRFWLWSCAGGLAVALQFLAGYPEYSFYSGIIAAGYALSLSLRGGRPVSRPLLGFLTIYMVGLAFAAVQLIPAVELELLARRPATLSLKEFQSLAASPVMVLGWVVPNAVGSGPFFPPFGVYYVGMLAVVFAIEGLRGRGRWFFLALLVSGYLFAVGPVTPLSALAHQIPGLRAFRHPFKHLLEVVMALSVLSAVGVERFVGKEKGSAVVVAAAALLVVGANGYFATQRGASDPGLFTNFSSPAARAALAAAGALIFLLYVLSDKRRLAVAWAFVALCFSYASNRPAFLQLEWKSVDRAVELPETARLMAGGGRFLIVRQVFQDRRPEYLLGDFPTEFHVKAVHGAGPFLWKPLADATSMIEEERLRQPGVLSGDDPMLDILGCRYVLSTREGRAGVLYGAILGGPSYREVERTDDHLLVERRNAYPELHFVDAAICTAPDAISKLVQGTSLFDLRKTALVSCRGWQRLPRRLAQENQSSWEVVERGPGHWAIRTVVPEGSQAFLVVGQADMPGWSATIDGSRTEIYRSYGLLQGILVPGGENLIVLEYRPVAVLAGAVVSTVTFLLIVALVAIDCMRFPGAPGAGYGH